MHALHVQRGGDECPEIRHCFHFQIESVANYHNYFGPAFKGSHGNFKTY